MAESRPADPRAGVLTIYGRQPVLEALTDPQVLVRRVIIAEEATGGIIGQILAGAAERGVEVRRMPAVKVSRISRNGRQDQGVAADLEAPRLGTVDALVAQERTAPSTQLRLIALDGVTTQDNAGMIIRAAAAAGLEGVILPQRGTAGLDPRVVKASAGLALRLPVHRCDRLEEALSALEVVAVPAFGLDGAAGEDLFATVLPPRLVLVVGNESHGLSPEVRRRLAGVLAIPLAPGVDSLNAAGAATLAAFALAFGLRRHRIEQDNAKHN